MTTDNAIPWIAESKQRQQRRKRQRELLAEARQTTPDTDPDDTDTTPTGDPVRDLYAHQAATDTQRHNLLRIFGTTPQPDDDPPTAA